MFEFSVFLLCLWCFANHINEASVLLPSLIEARSERFEFLPLECSILGLGVVTHCL